MASNTKVPLGIFWDIENCPIPPRKSAASVAKQIRDFVSSSHPECGYAMEFSCVCDATKVSEKISKGLDNNGVLMAHVRSDRKNAADAKLEELIDMFTQKFSAPSVLVVITGDINFAKPIRNARRKDISVVLIHGSNCSQDLRNLVDEHYLYDDVIVKAENENQNNTVDTSPVDLTINNLSKDVDKGLIKYRLSQMCENTGGKVMEVSDTKALIHFKCREDGQRAVQRMNGEDCYGVKLKLSLNNLKPVQNEKSGNKENSNPISIPNPNPIPIPVSKDCKSVIQGIETKRDQNVLKLVRKMVDEWKDKQIHPNLIASVERNTKKAQEDGMVSLFVTAVNPEANKQLINGAKKYIDSSHTIKWSEFRELNKQKSKEDPIQAKPKPLSKGGSTLDLTKPTNVSSNQFQAPDDCKFVIRGMETKKDQNVAKIIRKIISSWKDDKVNPNFVISVQRNTKQAQIDGKVTLFGVASSPENCQKILNAAKHYVKREEKIRWKPYVVRPKRSESVDSLESLTSNISSISSVQRRSRGRKLKNKTKLNESELKKELINTRMNMQLFTGLLFDNNSDPDYLSQLYQTLRSMQTKYIINYMNAFQSNPIIVEMIDINRNLDNLFTIYEKRFGKPSVPIKEQTKNEVKNMSVILGIHTLPSANVMLLVRSIISRWNDRKILPEDVISVSRDAKYRSKEGKAMLFVTAKNNEVNKLIVKMAKINFNNPDEKLMWNKYTGNK